MGWSDNARKRFLFLILDQPPLVRPDIVAKIQQCITDAAVKGIRIIPVVASAEDGNRAGSMEYLMRSIALGTNETYVALTDHSQIGDHHEKPTTDSYDVEIFNDLIKRLISRYVFLPPCNSTEDNQGTDTAIAWNSGIITREIIDVS